jgi:hypothetical protein
LRLHPGRLRLWLQILRKRPRGWSRNLLASEVVEQIVKVEEASGEKVNNLVFMGMGEPLANFENVMRAIEIPQCAVGRRNRRTPDHGFNERTGTANPPACRSAPADSPRNLPPRRNRRSAAADHAGEQKVSAECLLEACDYYAEKKNSGSPSSTS